MIDTSPSSLRLMAILVLGVVWFYILCHPATDDK